MNVGRIREPLFRALRDTRHVGDLFGPVFVKGVNTNDLATRGAESWNEGGEVLDQGLGALLGAGKVAPGEEELGLNVNDDQGRN